MDRNFLSAFDVLAIDRSLSARRAWIEITLCLLFRVVVGSLSARRAWIEIILLNRNKLTHPWSLSARRAWIEIRGVSLNIRRCFSSLSARRAWIEIVYPGRYWHSKLSLSARRAWIEISGSTKPRARRAVALRKESVDRNKRLGLLGWLRTCRSPQGERG